MTRAGMLREVGEIAHFTGRFFHEAFRPRFEWRELVHQCFVNGYRKMMVKLERY